MHSGMEPPQVLVPADMHFRDFKGTPKPKGSTRRPSIFGRLGRDKAEEGENKSRLLSSSDPNVISRDSTTTTNVERNGTAATEDGTRLVGGINERKKGWLTWGRRGSYPGSKSEKKAATKSSFYANLFPTKYKEGLPNDETKTKKERQMDNQENERMAQLIENMELDGKSEAEIAVYLAYLHEEKLRFDEEMKQQSKVSHVVGQWFKEWVESFREEIQHRRRSEDGAGISFAVSVNPFLGAPPDHYSDPLYEMDMTYEDLLTLEPVYTGVKSLAHLPVKAFNGDPLPSQQTACPICLSEYEVGEELRSLQCFHFFHRECVDRWLDVSHACPVCKGYVQ